MKQAVFRDERKSLDSFCDSGEPQVAAKDRHGNLRHVHGLASGGQDVEVGDGRVVGAQDGLHHLAFGTEQRELLFPFDGDHSPSGKTDVACIFNDVDDALTSQRSNGIVDCLKAALR